MENRIKDIAESAIAGRDDLFIVEVKISGKIGMQKIAILLDGDQGVGIDDCSGISRKIASTLEEENFIKGKYILEVSSPGVDNPLKSARQYPKNIGRNLKLSLTDGAELTGRLTEVSAHAILLSKVEKKDRKTVNETIEIPFQNIEKAKVLISF